MLSKCYQNVIYILDHVNIAIFLIAKSLQCLISQKCECDFNMYDAQIRESFQIYVVSP
jgi:hypothetical protein